MKTFLGLGECMIELSGAGENLWRQNFAGDVFNTLWYARASLGSDWRVRFFSAVGTDPISDALIVFAESVGIDCRDIPRRADRLLGLYAIHLKGAERSFSYWRDASAARTMMKEPTRVAAAIDTSDVIYVSGITLAILPAHDALALIGMMQAARAAGRTVAFDPNIRPRLWGGRADMRDVIMQAAGAASIVMPSFDDEAMTFGDRTPQDTARRYAAGGAGHVVVKNGDAPTNILRDDALQAFDVPKLAAVVDTTAAGDSFNGAYLARFLDTFDVEQAARAGQACAGLVVGTRGALVPFADLTV